MTLRIGRRFLTLALSVIALIGGLSSIEAADSAVVLVYQRVGETERHPLESATRAQFDAHLAQLKRGGFRVMALREIVTALATGRTLPERSVAITFDNAFKSAHRVAWPKLDAAGFPFSVFVATDAVDARQPDVMSWDELRALASTGAAIESRGASNRPLWRLDQAAQRADIARGRSRIEAEIGRAPELFAYPSGEASEALRTTVRELGFDAAFGLRSGPLHAGENRYALPRFELNETYGELERFTLIAAALPLPIRDLAPKEAILDRADPRISFMVDVSVGPLDALACYVTRQGRAKLSVTPGRDVMIELARAFEPGHDNRINCTLPGRDGRTHWLGLQYVVP